MARKTVDLNALVSRANGIMAAPSSTPEACEAIQRLISDILVECDAYNGFRYVKPGGEPVPSPDVARGKYEPHRVKFYAPVS